MECYLLDKTILEIERRKTKVKEGEQIMLILLFQYRLFDFFQLIFFYNQKQERSFMFINAI